MKKKILIVEVAILLVVNICLIVALGKVKKDVKELNNKVDDMTKTEEVQNRTITSLQTEIAHLKVQQQEEGTLTKKGK